MRRWVTAYLERLGSNMTREGPAYGFTLTIWGAGHIGVRTYGLPSLPEVFLFVTSPLLAYVMIAIFLRTAQISPPQPDVRYHSLLSFVDILSVPAAIGASEAIYLLLHEPLIGFPAASLAATVVYNIVLAARQMIFPDSPERS